MAEIENKRTGREGLKNCVDRPVKRRATGQKRQGIEITLNRPHALHLLARKAELDHPIETDSVDRNTLDIRDKLRCRAARKSDDLRVSYASANRRNDPGARLDTPFAKFIGRQ